MDPMPLATPIAFPSWPLDLLLLVALASVAAIYGLMLWSLRVRRERRRLICPVRHRPARVTFRLDHAGARTGIEACSLLEGRPIGCGGRCLHPALGG